MATASGLSESPSSTAESSPVILVARRESVSEAAADVCSLPPSGELGSRSCSGSRERFILTVSLCVVGLDVLLFIGSCLELYATAG